MSVTLQNPLLPGFHPDPSICRVGDDYYMVTSSFSYFPGVPIYHSKDLAHWEQIGHVLDRPEQLPLSPFYISGGLYAPTLRYHDGIFYMITTNINLNKNFVVTAENPAGPWSEPHWIEGAEGIDPSLFWDDDGKAYYTGTANNVETSMGKRQMIWLSEIDLKEFKLVGEISYIWGGSLVEQLWPEGPHLYKVDGFYYLLIAEGGTEHFHSASIARAEHIRGPYSAYRGNPILTQRHLGMHAPIADTGHADLIQCQDGSWYAVFLGTRPYGGYHKNLGRETFIAPVRWENGWPLVSPDTGSIQFTYEGPDLPEFEVSETPVTEDFDSEKLSLVWNYLGTPDADTTKIEDGFLKIKLYDKCMGYGMHEKMRTEETKIPQTLGFLGRRQEHMSFTASTKLCFEPGEKQTAGMTILQNDFHQIRMEIGKNVEGMTVVRAVRGYRTLEGSLIFTLHDDEYREEILAEIPWNENEVVFIMQAEEQEYTLMAENAAGERTTLAVTNGGFLGSETATGFVGAYIGMFASGNGTMYDEYAAFDWFTYEGK